MKTNRYANVFREIKGKLLPGINFHDKQSKKLADMLGEFAKQGMSIEDVIAGLIVIYMTVEGYQWEDFWIVVAKVASKVPMFMDSSEESE